MDSILLVFGFMIFSTTIAAMFCFWGLPTITSCQHLWPRHFDLITTITVWIVVISSCDFDFISLMFSDVQHFHLPVNRLLYLLYLEKSIFTLMTYFFFKYWLYNLFIYFMYEPLICLSVLVANISLSHSVDCLYLSMLLLAVEKLCSL